MTFPIICHGCKNVEKVSDLTSLSACAACGSDDIDLHDGEVHEAANSMGDFVPPKTTPELDKKLDEADAKEQADNDAEWQEMLDARIRRTQAKLQEIAAGVIATNPSMTFEAALEVAQKTVERYPRVAGLHKHAELNCPNCGAPVNRIAPYPYNDAKGTYTMECSNCGTLFDAVMPKNEGFDPIRNYQERFAQ